MREAIAGKNNPKYKHGGKGTRLYSIWLGIKKRCYNTKCSNFKIYGGRGIGVCNEWMQFENFRIWALSNGYQSDLSIDRIDNDKDYCPENCRWANRFQQNGNRSSVRELFVNDERFIMSTFSRKFGISEATVSYWLDRGYSGIQILNRFSNGRLQQVL